MYFWNVSRLKQDIQSNNLSEKDKFIYFAIYTVINSLFIGLSAFVETDSTANSTVAILNFIAICVGTYMLYRANGGSGGYDFLGRYFSLGFVVMIRVMVFVFPFGVAVGLMQAYHDLHSDLSGASAAQLSVTIVTNLALYGYFYRQMKAVNHNTQS